MQTIKTPPSTIWESRLSCFGMMARADFHDNVCPCSGSAGVPPALHIQRQGKRREQSCTPSPSPKFTRPTLKTNEAKHLEKHMQ
eukprot:1079520-Amphidinium_carterae.1